MIFSNLLYRSSASIASLTLILVSEDSIGLGPIDQPVLPSICPSIHHPSRTLKLITPLWDAFIPLVPDASRGRDGGFWATNNSPTKTIITFTFFFIFLLKKSFFFFFFFFFKIKKKKN